MKHGFVKVAAATPKIRLADTAYNAEAVIREIDAAAAAGVKVLVLPELCVTGYTCGDLFYQDALLSGAADALKKIAAYTAGFYGGALSESCLSALKETAAQTADKRERFSSESRARALKETAAQAADKREQSLSKDCARVQDDDAGDINKTRRISDMLIFVGLPLRIDGKVYNVAAAVKGGKILGFIPKKYLPNYNEFYDKRQFAGADSLSRGAAVTAFGAPVSDKLIFVCGNLPELKISAEICEDLWVMSPPSVSHATAGATLIVNLSASDELIGKAAYRRSLVAGQSARLLCGYVYASAGDGESVADLVFSGHNLVAENGFILDESELFRNRMTLSEIDVKRLAYERSKFANYPSDASGYTVVPFSFEESKTELTREFSKNPFVPADDGELSSRAELILTMQAHALKSKLGQNFKAVIGLSGGLDSALALLVTVRAMKLANRPLSDVIAITMPAFGTSGRTLGNACSLASALKVNLSTIKIKSSVSGHLKDIAQFYNDGDKDLVYENAQARGRTYVLMDVANAVGGIVVGTGDLSEAALGWCTYNGDHMSMYGVNSSVPKTLVKYLVKYEAKRLGGITRGVLKAILDTPISPELTPPEDGEISQKTEEIIGPYELHDFFLYYFLRCGFSPDKILRIAIRAFGGEYTSGALAAWLQVFLKRFFNNQFKRNCVPDGVKIGSVSLSPRGDWRMPSEASYDEWLKCLEPKPN